MHVTSYIAAAAAIAGSVVAAPAPKPDHSLAEYITRGVNGNAKVVNKIVNETVEALTGQGECMTEDEALIVAGTFQSLIQGYTKKEALAALTPDFVDYTSAVSIIINKGGSEPEDVTKPVFTSRDEFMQGHGTQEPIPFDTIKVWHTCDGTVTMVWRSDRSAQGQETESAAIPVIGVAVLETELASKSKGIERQRAEEGGYKYRIHTLWSEFNTAAWLVNNGVFTPETPVTPVPAQEVGVPNSKDEGIPNVDPSQRKKRGLPTSKFDVGLA